MITPRIDSQHDILGFTHAWVKNISKNVEKLYIITLELGPYDLPGNVEIYTLADKKFKLNKLAYLQKLLALILPRIDSVFVHMFPDLVILSSPLAWFYRKKIIFWYTHRHVSFKLKLAVYLSHKVITASQYSLRLRSPKIKVIGHAIDTNHFKPKNNILKEKQFTIIAVGRIDRVKNYETLIRAFIIIGNKIDCIVNIIGKTYEDQSYFESLKTLVKVNKLKTKIQFLGSIPNENLAKYYLQSHLFINLTRSGSFDKSILEAMACGIPVLTCNRAIHEMLSPYEKEFSFEYNAPADLATKIIKIYNNYDYYQGIAFKEFRKKILTNHSTSNLGQRIMSVLS